MRLFVAVQNCEVTKSCLGHGGTKAGLLISRQPQWLLDYHNKLRDCYNFINHILLGLSQTPLF